MSTELLAAQMGAGIYSKPIEDACIRWGIVEGEDKARFIAQLHVESMGFTRAEELTGYTTNQLYKTFPGRNGLTPELARALAARGREAMMNFVYGGTWGRENLGNTEPGDGWRFRGRGLIQTTGRENYAKTSIGCYGNLQLIDDPDILLVPSEAANSAAYYWYSRRLNGVRDVVEVTRRINPGLMHLDRRRKQTARALDLLRSLTVR